MQVMPRRRPAPFFLFFMKINFPIPRPSLFLFLRFSFLLTGVWGCRQAAFTSDEAAQSLLSTFELEPGFEIELVAVEPLVADPVAMEIDEYGRMYVVEMHGYPLDKSGTGKVKLLFDTNGDGRMDQSTLFAEGLMLPTGIMRWKKGVLVTDAPHLLYLEDTDGDGQADLRDTLLTGFALSNPKHNFNSPLYGLDNWIYLGHEGPVTANVYEEDFGDRGSDIRFAGQTDGPRLPNTANNRNVRFRPESHALEALSGRTQFGHTFTAYGSHLLVSNAHHLFQEMIAARYLQRNPHLLVPEATRSLPDHGDAAEIFPVTQDPEHQLLTDVGVMTSACGLTAYLGGAFPTGYDSVAFVAEPVHNLIHADKLSGQGSSYVASRLQPDREFLASTDAWFRPVNMYIGPDGALYVLDYHRQIVEHPEWMAEEVAQSGALYNGTDQGRIYRITATGAEPAAWPRGLRLGDASGEELVAKLADPNIWWRRNAQRLLVDRNDPQVVPALLRMAKNLASPLGRLHALWTLEGLGQLPPEVITQALRDPVPGVRENAIRLAELHLAETPSLAEALLALQRDTDPKVAYQLLYTLGFVDTPQAAQVRQDLLFRNLKDEWVQVAALSARSSEEGALLSAVLDRYQADEPAYASLVRRLSGMAAARQQPGAVSALLQEATAVVPEEKAKWQPAVLEGLAQGLKNKKSSALTGRAEQDLLIRAFFAHPSAPVRQASLRVLQVIGLPDGSQALAAGQTAARVAGDRGAPSDRRAEAVRFLALGQPASQASLLRGLLVPQEPLPLQLAALDALSAIPDETVSRLVLEKWEVLTPELREAA
ncbi:hypothetical protein BH24BAC1_BH24BAC1_30150 [soil metagenome]